MGEARGLDCVLIVSGTLDADAEFLGFAIICHRVTVLGGNSYHALSFLWFLEILKTGQSCNLNKRKNIFKSYKFIVLIARNEQVLDETRF